MQQLQRLAERLHEARDLRRAAAGQHDEHEAAGIELQALGQRRRIEIVQPVEPLDQRMADVGARRAAEALVRVRLERQQRQT